MKPIANCVGIRKKMIHSKALLILVLVATGCHWSSSQGTDNIERIGNKIAPSNRGADIAGQTLLANDQALTTGRLFAFSAFFRSFELAVLQIWRPTNETNAFRLIAEVRVVPTVEFQREDVYIESLITQKCIQVQNGDKIGCYTESVPAPIAFTFDGSSPSSLYNLNPNISDPYRVGDIVEFDTLNFPYLLSLAAYIDTDNFTASDSDYVDCPIGRRIPLEPTIPPATQAPPPQGDTGATGPGGMPGIPGSNGATGQTGLPGVPGVNGSHGEVGATGPPGVSGLNGTDGKDGADGFTGATGPAGIPGAIGPPGQVGPPGPPGIPGEKGDPGNNGKDGKDGRDGKDGKDGTNSVPKTGALQDQETSMWNDPSLMIVLLVWLIIITVMMIILSCCFCWCAHKMKQVSFDYGESGGYVNTGYNSKEYSSDPQKKTNRLSSFEPGQEWIRNMKPEDDLEYENSTIMREKSLKGNSESPNGKQEVQAVPAVDYESIKVEPTVEPAAGYESVNVEDDVAAAPVPEPVEAVDEKSTSDDLDEPSGGMSNRWSRSQEQIVAY